MRLPDVSHSLSAAAAVDKAGQICGLLGSGLYGLRTETSSQTIISIHVQPSLPYQGMRMCQL